MRLFFKRHWPLIGVAVVIVVAGYFFLHSLTGDGRRALIGGIIPGEGLRLKKIHYTHEDPERGLRWVLEAEQVTFSDDRNSMVFRDFLLTLEPESRPAVKVSGERGRYDRLSGLISLAGNVDAETSDGYRIRSERLLVHEKERTVSSDLPVRLSGPFFSVDGTGLLMDLENETLGVHSQVTTKVTGKAVGL